MSTARDSAGSKLKAPPEQLQSTTSPDLSRQSRAKPATYDRSGVPAGVPNANTVALPWDSSGAAANEGRFYGAGPTLRGELGKGTDRISAPGRDRHRYDERKATLAPPMNPMRGRLRTDEGRAVTRPEAQQGYPRGSVDQRLGAPMAEGRHHDTGSIDRRAEVEGGARRGKGHNNREGRKQQHSANYRAPERDTALSSRGPTAERIPRSEMRVTQAAHDPDYREVLRDQPNATDRRCELAERAIAKLDETPRPDNETEFGMNDMEKEVARAVPYWYHITRDDDQRVCIFSTSAWMWRQERGLPALAGLELGCNQSMSKVQMRQHVWERSKTCILHRFLRVYLDLNES